MLLDGLGTQTRQIEELNAYLCGEAKEELLLVGEKARLGNIRFVLTLDADTQLPHDTARRLVETLAHPLNRPRFSCRRSVGCWRDLSLFNPASVSPCRVPPLPPSHVSLATRKASIFILMPYPMSIKIYLAKESSMERPSWMLKHFTKSWDERFPRRNILSHDLIEGSPRPSGLCQRY